MYKKILWLCNCAFSDDAITGTGSWLQPLAAMLQQTGKVQICNITSGAVSGVTRSDYMGIEQWIIPDRNKKSGHVLAKKTCKEIRQLEEMIHPDMIHIWGTERFWTTLHVQDYLKAPVLLDIQGLIFACAEYYYGGLTFSEIFRCIHLKEIMMPWRTLFQKKNRFRKIGICEVQHLKAFKHISCQSEWVKGNISFILPDAKFYAASIMLRKEFYTADPWRFNDSRQYPVVFSMASGAITYKGIHVLLKAIAELKRIYPDIRLELAGSMNIGNRLLDGYSIFLKKLIKKLNITENVVYLGSLNAKQIIGHLQSCSVCVIPSFVESYCVALAEAMITGAPTVVSFAGAMPELGEHNKSLMFYNSLDHRTCASYISRLIDNKNLAISISGHARKIRLEQNDINRVINIQLQNYDSVLTFKEQNV
jgi:glycosyltransferase involved in cell wall biosynthesis